MRVKAIEEEWYQDYKLPSMFIAFPHCSFKCDMECGEKYCQNSHLANIPDVDLDVDNIIKQYLGNHITKSIVCGGLEPFDDFGELYNLIDALRNKYRCDDTVVIYSGYYKHEIEREIQELKSFNNIIVKFGRFIPNALKRYDSILGVHLSSENQYAEKIS